MLFIIQDFLKVSTLAFSSKYFKNPRHVGQKKCSRGVTRVPESLLHWIVDNDQSILAFYLPHCMIKHVLK